MPTKLRMLVPAAGLALAVGVELCQPAFGQVPVDVANPPVPWDVRVTVTAQQQTGAVQVDAAGTNERLVVTDIIVLQGNPPRILRGAATSTECGSTSLVINLSGFEGNPVQRFTTPAGIGFEPGEQLCVGGDPSNCNPNPPFPTCEQFELLLFGYTQVVPDD